MGTGKFRWISALLALAGVVFIWGRVVTGNPPPHGAMSLMMVGMALCVVHAVGWKIRAQWERYLFFPPLPWVVWLLALYLSF
ncbi:cyd operon YbgE family protein [Gallaecimonas pentaromativorans]|uniref:Cyd operon protein YbgE n=1 Tax=Gallaecimonas pentaromativorans TaxID=584787 RepID=A0A3N1NUY2_9GAMM|nr:cyd operon YbgE family protein [Gallaecimonas pentaromativorans]MED5525117.1 cyd operon YbgE family protein [Pseudomonadota bacterium]ROQ22652.1 Cyd operon protein YbgE [Gallaecimonas pentaromativorans]